MARCIELNDSVSIAKLYLYSLGNVLCWLEICVHPDLIHSWGPARSNSSLLEFVGIVWFGHPCIILHVEFKVF
ncbi:unnamed protein product [Sphagnum tenellum]